MDGIAGILPYNAFLIPDNRLPERYRGRVGFAVFSIKTNEFFEPGIEPLMKIRFFSISDFII